MNVLDAMKRLMVLVEPRRNYLGQCAECGTPLGIGAPHIDGCSYLAMPQIVAALEIAIRIAEGDGSYDVTKADFDALQAALGMGVKVSE